MGTLTLLTLSLGVLFLFQISVFYMSIAMYSDAVAGLHDTSTRTLKPLYLNITFASRQLKYQEQIFAEALPELQ